MKVTLGYALKRRSGIARKYGFIEEEKNTSREM